jgi:branched-chain amino acid transport system permease protein
VFVLVIVAMVLVGRRLPQRGSVITALVPVPRPRPRSEVTAIALLGAILSLGFVVMTNDWRLAVLTSVIASVLALSLVVITGFVGQIALSQMAFAGIAAFALSRFTVGAGLGFPLAPLLAALVATAAGIVIGIPALRVRGVNLAIVTLAGGVAVQEFVFKNTEFVGDLSTGGARINNPVVFGVDLGLTRPGELFRIEFCILATVVATLLAIGVANLRASGTGRRMLSVRGNERAAAAAGVNVAAMKLLAFGLSSFIAGLGGTLIGYRFSTVSDQSFGYLASLAVVAFAFLGGITSVRGALIAGAIAADGIVVHATNQLLQRVDFSLGTWQTAIASLGLIITVVTNPNGLASVTSSVTRSVTPKRRTDPESTAY